MMNASSRSKSDLVSRSSFHPAAPIGFVATTARPVLLVAIAAIALSVGCGRLGLGGPADETAAKARPGDEQVALVLDGRDVTIGELNDVMKNQFIEEFLRQPEDRQFEMREAAIREMVQRHVVEGEAKKKGLTPEALYDEVTASAAPVSVEEVSSWFKKNGERLGGARLEEVAPQIEQFLQREHKNEAWSAFIDPKLEALSWSMMIAPPRKTVEAWFNLGSEGWPSQPV